MQSPGDKSQCAFCKIANAYPASPSGVPQDPDADLTTPSCHLLLSTAYVLAFLDIMPITGGHVLVIPREHRYKLSELKGSEGSALGMWLPVISRAVMKALGRGDGDWNIVQNNGASAAQLVPHVHYHIIPRGGEVPDAKKRNWTMFGRGQRDDLDDDEAIKLATDIRKELEKELKAMDEVDSDGRALLSKL